MSSSIPAVRPQRLVGFDTVGEVFRSGDRVFRGIYPGKATRVREILGICESSALFEQGLIPTREVSDTPHADLGYEAILEHPRIPFVTYPHEWPASMFKVAALFHIDLYERLHAHGLTLKDWHPYNVLFEGTQPVFVDFTSIVRIDDLPDEPHLVPRHASRSVSSSWDPVAKAIYEMYRVMFQPYFEMPMIMMERRRHAAARLRLYETALNSADSIITRREAFEGDTIGRLRFEIGERIRRRALSQPAPVKSRFFSAVRRAVEARHVALGSSAYSSYYEDKDEDFAPEPGPEWTAKQHSVHSAVTRFRPATLLDIGCNTGWFSALAARLGASVVAVDVDEASVDHLYVTAERDALDVLPLVADLTAPLAPVFPREFDDEPSLSLIGEGEPLMRSAPDRLQCDMVLALAVTHHMALGQGLSFENIAAILSRLARRYLCVEFVSMDDAMIVSDPGFFRSYAAAPETFGWYTRDEFAGQLAQHFTTVEEVPSHPATRRLFVCSR